MDRGGGGKGGRQRGPQGTRATGSRGVRQSGSRASARGWSTRPRLKFPASHRAKPASSARGLRLQRVATVRAEPGAVGIDGLAAGADHGRNSLVRETRRPFAPAATNGDYSIAYARACFGENSVTRQRVQGRSRRSERGLVDDNVRSRRQLAQRYQEGMQDVKEDL
jgi:hypothetical protein